MTTNGFKLSGCRDYGSKRVKLTMLRDHGLREIGAIIQEFLKPVRIDGKCLHKMATPFGPPRLYSEPDSIFANTPLLSSPNFSELFSRTIVVTQIIDSVKSVSSVAHKFPSLRVKHFASGQPRRTAMQKSSELSVSLAPRGTSGERVRERGA